GLVERLVERGTARPVMSAEGEVVKELGPGAEVAVQLDDRSRVAPPVFAVPLVRRPRDYVAPGAAWAGVALCGERVRVLGGVDRGRRSGRGGRRAARGAGRGGHRHE